MLIAVGAFQRAPFERALTFGIPGSEERMHGLIRDVKDGYVKQIAFVVPVRRGMASPGLRAGAADSPARQR
jgi:hypothetical protein